MPYLGNTPSTSFATVVKDSFNGGSTAYTLSKVATTNSVSVFVENVRQEPTTAYAVSGTTLTFTATTPSGTGNIYVLHMNPTTTTTHPAAQNLTAVDGTFTGNIDVDGTANLDVVDIDGAVDIDSTLTVSNDLTVGGIDFFVDTSGDKVGIGTATANQLHQKLTIYSSAEAGIQFQNNDTGVTNSTDGCRISVFEDDIQYTNYETSGKHIFNGGSSTASRLEIEADGDVNVKTGNLVIGTSGKGIDFSATANTSTSGASMSSELLDYYEEGTWTPTAYGGTTAGSFSATTVAGVYTRIGRIVHGEIRISSGSLSSAAGTMQFGGLPFAIGGTGYACSGSFAFNGVDFDPSSIPVMQLGASTNFYFLVSNDDSNWTTLTVSNFDSTITFIGTFIYQTA